MRVITGLARGRRLETLSGDDVRPTSDRIKEAVFSIIQFEVEGRCFLDLFAGSGQMGIEALSRGAAQAVFTDASQNSIDVVKRNLVSVGFMEKARVARVDYSSFLTHTSDRFDIAFLDPPYYKGLLDDALQAVSAVMKEHGIIICEHPADITPPDFAGSFAKFKQYRYGKIMITVYRKGE